MDNDKMNQQTESENQQPSNQPSSQPDQNPWLETLACGCQVMTGWRCPWHDSP